MSTRMVKRILQQRQQAEIKPQEEHAEDADGDEEEDDADDVPPRVANAFDILGLVSSRTIKVGPCRRIVRGMPTLRTQSTEIGSEGRRHSLTVSLF